MRRGLLAWSPAEIPATEFARRLAAVRARFAAAGLDALLVYSNFARPQAVSYLTNVVPFWSEAVLVVPARGRTVLVVGLPRRDETVIRPTGSLDDLVCDPDARRTLVGVLAERGLLDKRLAFHGGGDVPAPFFEALAAARSGQAVGSVDGLIDVSDDDGSSHALSIMAADLARNALAAASIATDRAETLVAAAELAAREGGAEEVQVLVAPDLARGDRLRRIEYSVPLAARFALSVSVAYKGHWVRAGRSVARGPAPAGWVAAAAATGNAAARLGSQPIAAAIAQAFAGTKIRRWSLEAPLAGNPLALVAHDGLAPQREVAPGQLVVLSAWADTADGPHFSAVTGRVGAGLILS